MYVLIKITVIFLEPVFVLGKFKLFWTSYIMNYIFDITILKLVTAQ